MTRKQKALRRRRIFLSCCAAAFIAVTAAVFLTASAIDDILRENASSTESPAKAPADVIVENEPMPSYSRPEGSDSVDSTPPPNFPT